MEATRATIAGRRSGEMARSCPIAECSTAGRFPLLRLRRMALRSLNSDQLTARDAGMRPIWSTSRWQHGELAWAQSVVLPAFRRRPSKARSRRHDLQDPSDERRKQGEPPSGAALRDGAGSRPSSPDRRPAIGRASRLHKKRGLSMQYLADVQEKVRGYRGESAGQK